MDGRGEPKQNAGAPALAAPPRPGALTQLLADLVKAPDGAGRAGWEVPPLPGETVGRFEVVREIGRGGFGVVYEAHDRELSRSVAFKAIQSCAEEPCSARVVAEAEAAARLIVPAARRVSTGYEISVRATDLARNAPLFQLAAIAGTKATVREIVDRLARDVRRRLREEPGDMPAQPLPSTELAPASTEAWARYVEGPLATLGELEAASRLEVLAAGADARHICLRTYPLVRQWKTGDREGALRGFADVATGSSHFYRGEILAELGRDREAVEQFRLSRRRVHWTPMDEDVTFWYYPRSLYFEAAALERLGEKDEARKVIGLLLHLWDRAHPDLPHLAEARALGRRLAASSGGK